MRTLLIIFNKSSCTIVLLALIMLVNHGTLLAQNNQKDECHSENNNCEKNASEKRKNKSNARRSHSRSRKINRNLRKLRKHYSRVNDEIFYTEDTIKVHKKVYVSLCVSQGYVRVNGWDRDEARVFVKGNKGNSVSFKVREKSSKSKVPVWVQLLASSANKRFKRNNKVCLSGQIEINLPKGSTVKIRNSKGHNMTSINSVRNVKIETLGGDILLSNVSQAIKAHTYRGNVNVRNSSGKMELSTTSGNISAFNTTSSEFGDYLKAKTQSGSITLQSVHQKEVDSSSNSGSIYYLGAIKPFGRYDFSTTNGSINLAVPAETSCQLTMSYGGLFRSELPISNLTKTRIGSLVHLTGKIGEGEANLNLKSFNGSIRIGKKSQTKKMKREKTNRIY